MSLKKILFTPLMFWLVFAGVGLFFLLPLRQSIRLGMDLAGGTYLTLQVQTKKAVESFLIENMQRVDSKLKQANKRIPTEKIVEDNAIILTFDSVQDAQNGATLLRTEMPKLQQSVQGTKVTMQITDADAKAIEKEAVTRDIDVLRVRLNKLGVADIPIAQQGEKNIIVELPDVADPQQAKAMIGTAAQLEFRIVEKFGKTKEEILYEYDGELPPGKEILPGRMQDDGFYLVTKYADVTGKMLVDAQPTFDRQTGQNIISFRLSDEGGKKFYELTSKNYGRPLAIVLDDMVISSPKISAKIGAEGQIAGQFTPDSARELAMLLKSGSFVAPVTFEEDRTIGPSLGAESIRQGLMSCLVGLGLLLIFSLFYYKLSGLFAFIALLFNMVLVLMGLSWLGATLTLPGIGGMLLTVGMAIDASILIYESIKDKLKEGITIKQAVNKGFSGAMMVILDANITTFIVGIVLYYFGTGPIQGFAVTMMLGIVATLITGLFFLRSLFTFVLNNFSIQKLSI